MATDRPPTGTERRDTPRVPVALHAIVKMAGRPFQTFRTRDLSLEGASIEIKAHQLAPQERVEIALKISIDGASNVYRLNAYVARVTPHGAAMMFEQINSESYAALLECVLNGALESTPAKRKSS